MEFEWGENKEETNIRKHDVNFNEAQESFYDKNAIDDYDEFHAESPDSAPYQTQINNELRRVMKNDSRETASIENDILNNEEFLRALKEKLETV